ncbi:MAG: DegV family protein [Candidatus Pacebacteria bacterium]|nr:DegV family protein [Candidatus Paceibacterota bacterium]
MDTITYKELKKMILFSCERITRDKEQINKINVFPVPDQDTGNNLAATLQGIKNAIEEKDFASINEFVDTVLDAALTAAQGNAGIIYTGFLAGFLPMLNDKEELTAKDLGMAFGKGYERARDSIQNPKEGTILDVVKAFAITFEKLSSTKTDIIEVFFESFEKANQALLETPNKMELLKKAGVVDAGGLGFLMILETYLDILKEQTAETLTLKPILSAEEEAATRRFVQILSNRYEVVALMSTTYAKESEIRNELKVMGNCLDIIQIGGRTKIHIHTDSPYETRDKISELGIVENLKIQDMAREVVGEDSVENVSIGIVIDERAGLSQKIIQHYDIEVIPLRINWPEEEGLAGVSVCEKIKDAQKKGTIARPQIQSISPQFFMESYKKQLEKFEAVLCIVSSSKLSDNYNSALKARELLTWNQREKVFVIDSRNISAGQSIVILEAIELIREQRRIKEIKERIEGIIPQIGFLGVLKNPYRNKKTAKSWFSKETPEDSFWLMNNKDGEIIYSERVRSNDFAEVLFQKIEKSTRRDLAKSGKRLRVVIAHADNLEQAEKLKSKLKATKKAEISFISITDPVTSINVCPESLIAGWIVK